MRSKMAKIVLILSLMLCMTTSMFAFNVNAEDSASTSKIDDCSKVFKAYTAERTSTYLEDDTYPTKEGYLFAGWYTTDELPETDEEAVEYVVEDSVPEGVEIVYALFVPDDVLTVKAQVSVHLINNEVADSDETGAIRFVTSVDSLLYKQVGFEVSYTDANNELKSATSASNKVYKQLYQADSTNVWSATPEGTFCGVSEYFKACTVKNVPVGSYTTEFTVKPFWITMSGDKVYGETATKTIEEGCLRQEVYVSSTTETDDSGNLIAQDLPQYGTYGNPYATLDYAIAHVKDTGTVRVRDSLTVASGATWTKHGKSITITGYDKDDDAETLDFSGMSSHLNIRDNVTFSALNLKFKQYVFCNGYSVKVSSDVELLNSANEVMIYGGGNTNVVENTNLELYAGSYKYIYGGSHNANITGNTNVVIGPGVNGTAEPSSHEKTYLLYGGCRIGTVGGNTNVIVQKAEEGEMPAKFNYVYGGGGYAESTRETATVTGKTDVEFAGQAYSLYGGGRYGTNADTRLVMTGGEVYQIFGGCENNSMIGNTDVQVLGGTVKRRIYGGCYNAHDNSWGTEYHVTGNIFVTIGTDAEVSLALNSEDDNSLYALTRDSIAYDSEKGVFIFNDYENSSSNINKIGPDSLVQAVGVSTKTHHYQVNASAGGKVTAAGNCIYIEPKDNNNATVKLDSANGTIVYYAEEAGYYPLPELVNGERDIYVIFDTPEATDFMSNAAAKISTGNDLYAYYTTLDEAIAAAEKSDKAMVTAVTATNLASIAIAGSANGTVTSNYKNCVAGTEVTLTVSPDEGYYCSALTVKKDGEKVELPELTLTGKTYAFATEVGAYTVKAIFAKKVFDEPTSSTNTSWDLVKQNESTETLANGGTKITGTVVATDLQEKDKMDAIAFVDKFIEMDFTFVAKDDPSTTAGNGTPGTQVVMDFGEGCSYQIRVVKNSGNIVLRAVGGLEKSVNRYTFTTEQADKFNSADGVKVRIVRYGTEIMFYVDGAYATTVDLSEFANSIVTDDTEMTVSIKRFGDTGTAIAIPFTVIDTVIPVAVNIKETTNGTITTDRTNYFAGDIATITVNANSTDYYCNKLGVNKKGETISLDKALNMTDTTYNFVVGDATCTVEASFAKKVFEIASSNGYTSWNLLQQNESAETLANGGAKITGTVVATDLQEKDKMDAIAFVDKFTEMDFTFVAKDDPSTTAGNGTPGTQVVMDFGEGCSYQIRVVKNSGNIVLRAVGGLEKSVNRYTFTTEQADKFNSADGVKVRIVRYGTEIMFYVDGAYATTVDLSEFTDSIVTDDTEMTVSIKRFGDTGTAIAIPYTIANKVSPMAVQVYDGSTLAANDTVAADVQNIDLTSNETYSVKLTPQGFDSTAYFKITYVDHVTNETQSYYTPAIAAGESFEFTYQNGVFDSETEAEIATIRWENRIKATKDVLAVEVFSGEPEGETIADGAVLGNVPMAKPASTTVETTWTIGTNIGSYNHSVAEGFTPGKNYAHTDVITVEKKGTKLTFTDDVKTNSWASDGCYVVSSWKQNATTGEWELDHDGTNIPGKYEASKTITCTDGYELFVERYGTEDEDGSITYTYITSKDNETIRFCYFAGAGTTTFPTITSTYSGETGTAEEIALAAETDEWLENDKNRAYYDIFEGKTISVIGDSYMAGSSITDTADVWVNMFAKKYSMTINNHGVNGSTISNYAGSTYNPMVDRWEEDFANDTPDIIIVEGGRNDYNYNTPMGELGSSDKKTFKGATTYLISNLKEKYPNAIIIGITCWEVGGNRNAAGYYCSDYGRAFIEACEELGVSYINSMDSDAMGVYMTSSNFRGRFCIKAGDISHLNEKGMKLVLPVFEEKIYMFCTQ